MKIILLFILTGMCGSSLFAQETNPVTNFLTLRIEGESQGQYFLYLYDNNGKQLEKKNVEGNETTIDMSNLFTAIWIHQVMQNKNRNQNF